MKSFVEQEWLDESTGYVNLCVFTFLGHRCGYVGVDKSNPLWGKDYTYLEDIEVYGGLTFSGQLDNLGQGDLWFFGFDCAHIGDSKDLETLERYIEEGKLERSYHSKFLKGGYFGVGGTTIKTSQFVINECERLSSQLKTASDRISSTRFLTSN